MGGSCSSQNRVIEIQPSSSDSSRQDPGINEDKLLQWYSEDPKRIKEFVSKHVPKAEVKSWYPTEVPYSPRGDKRLFIYTSARQGSLSSQILDKIARKTGDTAFKVWDWELWNLADEVIDLRNYTSFSPQQQALFDQVSAHKEWLDSFSEIYIGVPLYNLGPGTHFKRYIDILIQPGVAFSFGPDGLKSLFTKQPSWRFVLTAGGNYLGGPEGDFLTPWIKGLFAFLGQTNLKFLLVNGGLYPGFDINKIPLEFK